jgi:hypothetical protein
MLPQRRGISATNTSNVAQLHPVERIGDTNQFKLGVSGTPAEHSILYVAAAIDGVDHEKRHRDSKSA